MPLTLRHPDTFVRRHLGPSATDRDRMLRTLGAKSLDALIDETVPASIRSTAKLDLGRAFGETELLTRASELGQTNEVFESYLGMGYSDCITPPVILRNILQNPGWYTQYTPYQAEISQGRLEALLNFQTLVCELTSLPVANASLLDEATAVAEAMHLAWAAKTDAAKDTFLLSETCHPQVIEVVFTRAEPLGIKVELVRPFSSDASKEPGWYEKLNRSFGFVLQYPDTLGQLPPSRDALGALSAVLAKHNVFFVVAADLLSLTLLVPPGEFGADIAVGSTQRFGVPLGYGGPHAAYFATKNDHVRRMPGRIIGVSKDANGKTAYRMALQTREQHIRRERATSNICTAQALLAIVASMYAVYHGPEGLTGIAVYTHNLARVFARAMERAGFTVSTSFFDTVLVKGTSAETRAIAEASAAARINLRRSGVDSFAVAFDEAKTTASLQAIIDLFANARGKKINAAEVAAELDATEWGSLRRTTDFLTHPVFHRVRSETEMLRYMRTLESRDLSLAFSMIPLGSCTMKLNATAEMMPITDTHWNKIHPFAPLAQAKGYAAMFDELERDLAQITGFDGVSLQPNAGAQGEYAGLLVIRQYLRANGKENRHICLIPSSAHGTNPASAVMAGLEVVVVQCDALGNVDLADLEKKAKEHSANLAALMITYPSTHGVFEEDVKKICAIVHANGGQVYMDGANMNAQVGLCKPAELGADVCHINLHKTFCIPHGGGGPGMGPICVAKHLTPYLPRKTVIEPETKMDAVGPVSAAPWGSASILLISWAYIRMMGGEGLTEATKVAILNANYIAARLSEHFPLVYKGKNGRIAHECILDMRDFKKSAGIEVDDIAKRLMDYGFHAPTMSFPIPGTLMVEPTESESLDELDRFCDAMIHIRKEIAKIESGAWSRDDNPLKFAPHSLESISGEWKHAYSRDEAVFPTEWTKARKFFPAVARINNALGDRQLMCTCPPLEAYAEA